MALVTDIDKAIANSAERLEQLISIAAAGSLSAPGMLASAKADINALFEIRADIVKAQQPQQRRKP